VLPQDGRGPLLPGADEPSQRTHEIVDEEVRRIVDELYDETVALLTRERDRLDTLAAALLEHETLDQDDAYAAAGVEQHREQAATRS
jgi:cell division protease FtsH